MLTQIRSLSLAAALAAVSLSALTGPSAAASRCAPHDDIVKVLNKKYQETRRALAVVSATAVMEIFLSPEGTWTMLVTNTQGIACITASGEAWQDVKVEVAGLES